MFSATAYADNNSGEYLITLKTARSCGDLPKEFTFKATFCLYEGCETNCFVSSNKNTDIPIKQIGKKTYLFDMNDGMHFIKFKDEHGESDEMKPNNKYFVYINNDHLSGMAITDKIDKCFVVYFVDGVKISN